jgi:hypothetical protein
MVLVVLVLVRMIVLMVLMMVVLLVVAVLELMLVLVLELLLLLDLLSEGQLVEQLIAVCAVGLHLLDLVAQALIVSAQAAHLD